MSRLSCISLNFILNILSALQPRKRIRRRHVLESFLELFLFSLPTIFKANLMTTKEEKCQVLYRTRKATTKRNVEPAEQFLFRCHRCRWRGEISAASSHQQPTVSGMLVNEMRTGKKYAKGNLAADKMKARSKLMRINQCRTANGSRLRAASCD